MTFQQLKYLVELSNYNSISKASEALYVTQPCITKAIKDLELELHIHIIERSSKGITFTNDGTELLFYARSIVSQSESLKYHFNQEERFKRTIFSVSSQHHSYVVAAMVKLMQRLETSTYEIYIREGKTSDAISDVANGKSQIGFIAIQEENRPIFEEAFHQHNVAFYPILSRVQHAYFRSGHPLAGKDTIKKSDLQLFPMVTYQNDDVSFYVSEWNTFNTGTSITPPPGKIYVTERGSMNEILSHTNAFTLGTGCVYSGYFNADIITHPIKFGPVIQLGYILKDGMPLSDETIQIIEDMTAIVHEGSDAANAKILKNV